MNDIEIITELYKRLCDASINKDIEALQEILADDYILIHMTGMRQSKQDYISSVINGELKYYESIHESIEVSVDGDKASVIGKTKTLASPFGTSKSWWRLRQDLKLEKRADKWVIVSSKASMY
ncbi:MAG: nuclear transport factor 2 family protein [Clostridia bacterium]|nr:nuclear transport factor 2 family protein [Clostridia bacterium]